MLRRTSLWEAWMALSPRLIALEPELTLAWPSFAQSSSALTSQMLRLAAMLVACHASDWVSLVLRIVSSPLPSVFQPFLATMPFAREGMVRTLAKSCAGPVPSQV